MTHKLNSQPSRYKALLSAILVTSACGCLWGTPVYGETPVTDANGNSYLASDNTNITGKDNTVTRGKNAAIVGDKNSVSNTFKDEHGRPVNGKGSEDVRIVGSNNTVEGSRRQHVIGDNNTIIARDKGTVTDYGHPEGRQPNASDLTIGRGNFLRGNDTYRNEWDSLTVIGNNNKAEYSVESAGGPAAGIVIGDNQNLDTIKDSVVIGSMSPAEQAEKSDRDPSDKKYTVGRSSNIIGYHSSNSIGGSVVIGNYSKADSTFQTLTGHGSTIEGGKDVSRSGGTFSSSFGALNSLESTGTEDEQADNVGNTVTGSLNRTTGTTGTMIVGSGNVVTNSQGPVIPNDTLGMTVGEFLVQATQMAGISKIDGKNDVTVEAGRKYMKEYMASSAGAVSILGSSNSADYTVRSQISGTNNMLKGQKGQLSAYNNLSGYGNEGENISRSTIVGTGNSLKNGEDNVVIGDFHKFDGGKHNVVLGSMASEEKEVTKTFANSWDGSPVNYTVEELVPSRRNTANIENAVMLGYNTDVRKNGGVALGSESVAARDKGVAGYDPSTKAASIDGSSTWTSTGAAVSVGDSTGDTVLTRQITNVAAGSEDTDAVNVAQLKRITSDSSTTINNRINQLDGRINRVGAGAAALAALHPLDFDPQDKWNFAAGYGNFHGANAMAIGAFYRPNEKAMFSVVGSFGGGADILNMGVSLKFGQSSPYADYSKAGLIQVINNQDEKIKQQDEKINSMQEQIDMMMAKLNL